MKKFNTEEGHNAFNCGVNYTKGYIAFCLRHYVYDLHANPQKSMCFQKDMLDFVLGKVYIPNRDNISFKEFCENYEKYRLKL